MSEDIQEWITQKIFKGCLSQILLGSILEYLDSYPSQFPL